MQYLREQTTLGLPGEVYESASQGVKADALANALYKRGYTADTLKALTPDELEYVSNLANKDAIADYAAKLQESDPLLSEKAAMKAAEEEMWSDSGRPKNIRPVGFRMKKNKAGEVTGWEYSEPSVETIEKTAQELNRRHSMLRTQAEKTIQQRMSEEANPVRVETKRAQSKARRKKSEEAGQE